MIGVAYLAYFTIASAITQTKGTEVFANAMIPADLIERMLSGEPTILRAT